MTEIIIDLFSFLWITSSLKYDRKYIINLTMIQLISMSMRKTNCAFRIHRKEDVGIDYRYRGRPIQYSCDPNFCLSFDLLSLVSGITKFTLYIILTILSIKINIGCCGSNLQSHSWEGEAGGKWVQVQLSYFVVTTQTRKKKKTDNSLLYFADSVLSTGHYDHNHYHCLHYHHNLFVKFL
jgi:hypothetical protein